MKKMIVRLYDNILDAEQATVELTENGILAQDINVITPTTKKADLPNTGQVKKEGDMLTGAVGGGAIGALPGLLIGAAALLIPGIGPIAAAGPLFGALFGATAGTVAGGFIGAF